MPPRILLSSINFYVVCPHFTLLSHRYHIRVLRGAHNSKIFPRKIGNEVHEGVHVIGIGLSINILLPHLTNELSEISLFVGSLRNYLC